MPTKRTASLPGTTDRRIDALLTLLAENSTIVISGAKIAKEIGVTRQQVWRWIEQLRQLGVRVKGHPRTGYHIERVPDILVPQMLSHRLYGTPFARRIFHFFKIDSTNSVAMQLGESGEPHGAVVLAEEQTAGRGRAGRSWASEKSAGIYCSILLRPPIPPAHAPLLTLVAGLAARDAAAEDLDALPDIRWPNDRARRRPQILRHPHRDARGARPHPLRRRRHRHQRQPVENARRSRCRSPRRCASKPTSRIRASSC